MENAANVENTDSLRKLCFPRKRKREDSTLGQAAVPVKDRGSGLSRQAQRLLVQAMPNTKNNAT